MNFEQYKTENGFKIEGTLNLSGTGITELPDNLTTGDGMDLRGTAITELPNNLTVGGGLDLRGTGITALPDNLTVDGYLYLCGTGITALPDNLTVGGALDLRGTEITELPDNLTVGGGLDLRGTGITKLPDNLTVGEYLYLSGTGITELTENLTVGGDLDLRGTAITELLDNLTVGGDLLLSGTGITKLPENLTVGGDGRLDLCGTGITELPDNLIVGGDVLSHKTEVMAHPKLNRPGPIIEFSTGYIKCDGILAKKLNQKGDVYQIQIVGRTEKSWLLGEDERYAHGETLAKARKDLIYKITKRNLSDYIGLKQDHSFTFHEAVECYRVITGACEMGIIQFAQSKGLSTNQNTTIAEIIDLTKGAYGSETFERFF